MLQALLPHRSVLNYWIKVDQVVGVDNLNDYYDVRLKEWRLQQLENHPNAQNFYFEKLDIENQESLKALFKNQGSFDAVLNLAARAGVRYSMENPHVYLSTNAEGTLNLLECMRENGCKKFVLASTSSLYAGQKMPFTEDLAVNEPLSPYAASKKAGELMAYSYHKLYQMDVSVVRYFTVFGPAGRPDMSFIDLLNGLPKVKPFKCLAMVLNPVILLMWMISLGEPLLRFRMSDTKSSNLGGGRNPVSLNTIIEKLEILIGKKAVIDHKPFHIADLMETWADIEKAKNLLGWEPKVSLDEGLEKSVSGIWKIVIG